MSTTRPYSPGDRGPESGEGGASGVSGDGVSVSGRPVAPTADGVSVTVSAGDVGVPSAVRSARRLSFEGESGVVPLARDFARQALHAWGWLPAEGADRRAAAEDVLLVVSELVTNACLHAEGPRNSGSAATTRCCASRSPTGAPASPHRAPRTAPDGPAATACSSCSGCAWTGESSAPRASPARPYGRNSGHPPDTHQELPAVITLLRTCRTRAGSPQIRRALCLPSTRPRAYLDGRSDVPSEICQE